MSDSAPETRAGVLGIISVLSATMTAFLLGAPINGFSIKTTLVAVTHGVTFGVVTYALYASTIEAGH